MKQWKRLVYYLLLNVLVSACATYAVLLAWDRTHNPAYGGLPPLFRVSANPRASSSTATPDPLPVAAATPTSNFTVYQAEGGERMEDIAVTYGVSLAALSQINGVPEDHVAGIGEPILIPLTPTPPKEPGVVIDRVVAPGDLASERVDIRLDGDGELSLSGWQLEDEDGYVYPFPILELVSSGTSVSVYTKTGTNNPNQVFWGLDQPVWRVGEVLVLRDEQGKERATYEVK